MEKIKVVLKNYHKQPVSALEGDGTRTYYVDQALVLIKKIIQEEK